MLQHSLNKATWKVDDDLLARAHLAVPGPALESNRLRRLTTYPKRFVADTALALALAELTAADLTSDPALAGPYFESYVMQQLRPQVDGIRGALTHVRTGSGEREVDTVIETGHRHVIGVEVSRLAARSAG